jgi:hypothetical protein
MIVSMLLLYQRDKGMDFVRTIHLGDMLRVVLLGDFSRNIEVISSLGLDLW